MIEALWQAFQQIAFDPYIWGIIVASAIYGMFVGSIPGLTATMATALLVPVTFWLEPLPALAAIVTMVACAIFAGDIPTVLLRIPGTPASAAYADDAYLLTRRGKSEMALGVGLVSSALGGLFGSVVLILLGHQLARVAGWFSVAEYFWLYLLGLSCAVAVSRGALLKGLLALIIGLLLSTVGLSAVHTQARFTLGQPELYQGINFIPAMIGLFGVSEVLRNLLNPDQALFDAAVNRDGGAAPVAQEGRGWGRRLLAPMARAIETGILLVTRRPLAMLRSSSIGTMIGMLPGAGADIASWVALAAGRRAGEGVKPEEPPAVGKPRDFEVFGKTLDADETAALDGLNNATAANNAALAGAWIPALVFGIPGDSVTAIVIGVLLMKNIQPGPEIFVAQSSLVYGLYMIFLLANLVMLPVGLLAITLGNRVVRVPRRVLLPIILLYCVVGSYAINGSAFDVGIMLAMGLFGFLLERRQVPLGPVVLGIILGGPLEERFIQTATGSGGSLLGFVDRPIAALLGAAWLILWVTIVVREIRKPRTTLGGPSPDVTGATRP